jgi:glycosyltransferase involved in cell wall biosynthesis
MTVAINARAAARAEIGGVERHATEMAARLPALGDYRVMRPPAALAHRAGHAWEQVWLPFATRDCELVYSPANLAPLASGRNAVVIHDLAAIRNPGWYGRTYAAWQRALLPRLARRAAVLLTVSEFSRRELVELLGVAPARVHVAPGGVDERFSPAARGPVERPYVLTVATRSARKNLAALERTRAALAERGIDLVAAGSGRAYMRAEDGGPRPLGYVPEADLPALYAGASAFVLPSLYEGLGLPCLEAMASGTPVVAADRAALPETCGGAALLVDPADPHAIADAVLAALGPERERLVTAGLERAKEFSWDRTARLTDAAIGSALGSRP